MPTYPLESIGCRTPCPSCSLKISRIQKNLKLLSVQVSSQPFLPMMPTEVQVYLSYLSRSFSLVTKVMSNNFLAGMDTSPCARRVARCTLCLLCSFCACENALRTPRLRVVSISDALCHPPKHASKEVKKFAHVPHTCIWTSFLFSRRP